MKGEKPSFETRRGLSELMGTPMSGEFTPQSLQAIQAVFAAKNQAAQQQPQGQGQGKSSGSKAKLSGSEKSFMTSDQTMVSRQQKAK